MGEVKEKLARFMYGRYGVDQLSRFLSALAVACIILHLIVRSDLLYWFSMFLLVVVYARMLSKNTGRRYQENMKYLELRRKAIGKADGWREAFACRKTHRVFICPGCGQKVRVPKGRGTVKVHCPRCNTSFIKKS